VWLRAIGQILRTSKHHDAYRAALLATETNDIIYDPGKTSSAAGSGSGSEICDAPRESSYDYRMFGQILGKVRAELVRLSTSDTMEGLEQEQVTEQAHNNEQEQDGGKDEGKSPDQANCARIMTDEIIRDGRAVLEKKRKMAKQLQDKAGKKMRFR
jgi:hypothetical protein